MNVQTQLLPVVLVLYPSFLVIIIVLIYAMLLRRKVRVPVKDKLLRSPGETLRRKLEKFDEQWVASFFEILIFGPACFLTFRLFAMMRPQSPRLVTEFYLFQGFVIVAVVIVSWKTIAALRRARNDSLGFRGERAVGEELNKLMLDGCLVYHDVPGEGAWNVDHVVVAPTGVYAIETKTRSKDKCAKDRKDYEVVYDGHTLQFPNWNDTHGIDQAKANAKWLAKHLSNALAEEIKSIPILTLPGWYVTSSVRPSGNELRVLNHKQIRSVIIDGRTPVLDDKRIKQIGYQLELKCRDVEF